MSIVWRTAWRAAAMKSTRTADEVEKRVSTRVRGGDVIVMHDGGGERLHTVQATDRLIRRFKNEGYEFVTVPGMMRAVGCTQA